MKSQLRAAFTVFGLLTILLGGVYPAVVTLIAQGVFPYQANGSVIVRDGKAVGSELVGQTFDGPRYFWGRLSATGPMSYNSEASSGSNLAPTSPSLHEAVRDRVKALRESHPDQSGAIPVDLVTASASGLDPHISPAAAEYQVKRVAKARGLKEDVVRELVRTNTEARTFGVLGEPRVNVLRLNLALDAVR